MQLVPKFSQIKKYQLKRLVSASKITQLNTNTFNSKPKETLRKLLKAVADQKILKHHYHLGRGVVNGL